MLLADSNEIGTFITDRLTPMVSLYTLTDNIAVRQLALWDLYAVRLASIRPYTPLFAVSSSLSWIAINSRL